MPDKVTGREIILGILENMQENFEPLLYTTLMPSLYDVYLHPAEYKRLAGVLPHIIEEARKALDETIDRMNREANGLKWKPPFLDKPQPQEMKYLRPTSGWAITFHQNMDDGVKPGDLLIESTLALHDKPVPVAGIGTRKILTLRSSGVSRVLSTKCDARNAAAETVLGTAPLTPKPEPETAERALARIAWCDRTGPHLFLMTKSEIVAGRGGTDYRVDLKLEASPDISREHFLLRRDEKTGEFFIRDLSSYGTTVNGKRLPSSMEGNGGERRDIQREALLPRKATIGLADALMLEFEAIEKK